MSRLRNDLFPLEMIDLSDTKTFVIRSAIDIV